MSSTERLRFDGGSYKPVGDPVVLDNGFFKHVHQPVDTVDLDTGEIKRSAADGAAQNYMSIPEGVHAVVQMALGKRSRWRRGEDGVAFIPQERYPHSVVLGRRATHLEVIGGGIDKIDWRDGADAPTARRRATVREIREEAGIHVDKDSLIPIGDEERGVFSHVYGDGRNFTFFAPEAQFIEEGPEHEADEVIGKVRVASWDDVETMIINNGIHPTGEISSASTIAALYQARIWKERHESRRPKVFDLGQFRRK